MAEDIVKAKIVFDTKGLGSFGGASPGGLGGAASRQASQKTTAGIGKIATGVAIGNALLGSISKGVSALVKASPQLQATLSIFGKGIIFLLRPIADTIALVLRPFALSMLKFAIPFYKGFRESAFFQAILTPKEERTGKQQGLAAAATLGTGIGAGAAVGAGAGGIIGALGGPAGAAAGAGIGAVIGGILGAAKAMIDMFSPGGAIANTIDEFLGKFGINMEKVREIVATVTVAWVELFQSNLGLIKDSIKTGLDIIKLIFEGDFIGAMSTAIQREVDFVLGIFKNLNDFVRSVLPKTFLQSWDKILVFLTITLPDMIVKTWESVSNFFTSTLPDLIRRGFDSIRDFFTVTIPSWIQSLINKVKEIFSFGIGSRSRGRSVGDALIKSDGSVINLDPKDNVLAFKDTLPGGSPTFNFTIHALDADSINSQTLDKIARAVDDMWRRGMSVRTTEGIGI